MQKLFTYFIALFVLFFACTQAPEKNDTNATANQNNTSEGIAPTKITPVNPSKLPNNYNHVDQASQNDLTYPKEFSNMGIPQFKGAKMDNNVPIKNDVGKYARRIKMTCSGSFDEVKTFYKSQLEKNGWEQNNKMNRTGEDEDVQYFVTNFTKDNYTQMFTIIDMGANGVSILQILKEN